MKLQGHTYYQSYEWGEYRRRHGWTPRRGTVLSGGRVAAMAQFLVREIRAARVAIVWLPGGPAGSREQLALLPAALRERYRGWLLYLRANSVRDAWPEYDAALTQQSWRRPRIALGSRFTFQLDLRADSVVRREALSQNWRHNLARSERRGSQVTECAGTALTESAYQVVADTFERKGLRPPFELADLHALHGAFGPAFLVTVAHDDENRATAVRGCIRFGDRADDFVSGASDRGRRGYDNYAVTWHLINRAGDQGAATYDLGGADPVTASGVYTFKRGLGGRGVDLVGEWEWSNSRILSWGLNSLIERRPGRLAG